MQFPLMLPVESLPRVIQGVAIGVVATIFVGFSFGGWMTSGTAGKIAQQDAQDAVIAALVPICVSNFQNAPNASEKLIELNKFTVIYNRGAYVEKGGWATMPGSPGPDRDVAQACASALGRLDRLEAVKK